MKLKNLLFATMVAYSFTACSENDPISEVIPPTAEAAEAAISFKASATSLMSKTKAATDPGTDAEKKISSLTVLVFQKADGSFVTSKTVTNPTPDADDAYSVDDVKAKATDVSVLLVANVTDPSIFTNKTLNACEGLTVARATASTDNNFVMSTVRFDGTLTAGKTNCFGYTATAGSATDVTSNAGAITLYRVAARVDLNKITVKFDQTTELKGAKLEITNVFMSNVRGTSKYMSSDLGSIENSAAPWYSGVGTEKTGTGRLLVAGGAAEDADLNWAPQSAITLQSVVGEVEKAMTDVNFYVLENSFTTRDSEANGSNNAYTLLVIQAKLYKVVDGEFTEPAVRYYTVKVNENQNVTGAGSGTGKILRNNIYKIENATLTGTGSNSPYEPEASMSVSAKVVVAPWNVVSQAPEIE